MNLKIGKWVKALLVMFALGSAIEVAIPQVAEARAGRGRSFGRSARPAQQPPSQQRNYQNDDRTAAPQNQPQGMMNQNRGGLMRGLAGGLAGGFLGSMLFGSLAHGAGLGGARGGIGLFEIILFAGLLYLAFRWWKNRQQPATVMSRSGLNDNRYGSSSQSPMSSFQETPRFRALAPMGIEQDQASDIFFKVQGAWTRRDLAPVSGLLGSDVMTTLAEDISELKKEGRINRLENITVRGTEVVESWEEGDREYSTVRFTANLLDYTVDEKSGQVVEGSDATPVKFQEDWTFAKTPQTSHWQLVGIEQV